MQLRDFVDADWPQVWTIVREVVRAQETFSYDPEMSEGQARQTWIEIPPGLTVVAVEGGRVIVRRRWARTIRVPARM